MNLQEKIIAETIQWRNEGYICEEYPAIKYILEHNYNADTGYRFLRRPQFEALEIYWYLRLKLNTPKFHELYQHFYHKPRELCEEMGIDTTRKEISDLFLDGELFDALLHNKDFVKKYGLENIHESLSLAYASYILALTMGAGKTILIASIIATEFAMSIEYDDIIFMKNALVFAPDKTIIESLREISDTPFEKILPPSDYQKFMTNMKLIYTQDGAKEINGLIPESRHNIIITNTQKIIPRMMKKNAAGFLDLTSSHQDKIKKEQEKYTINLRLQRIASLPSIGIFSDEAHHTYGNKIGDELKRVREAINYIGNETNIVCVVNTTGTPYSKKKVLKDVVYWYGLQQGIKDNILKSLENSIVTYDFADQTEQVVIDNVIEDFFTEYDNHALPNGAKAKIAFYFKNKSHLAECRTIIEKSLAGINISPALILQNTEDSSTEDLKEFNSLNNPDNQKRIMLLIQKGTEGWNCPSLFATALIREVSASNNFVLQASTRCLRQVAGNDKPARIYIERKNQRVLNKELEENFGTSLSKLKEGTQEYETHQIIIKKPNPPKLVITKRHSEIRTINQRRENIQLNYPDNIKSEDDIIYKTIYQPNLNLEGELLGRAGTTETIKIKNDVLDLFTATKDIANRYHLAYLPIFNQLKKLYPAAEIPKTHISALCMQIDETQNKFETIETLIIEVLALIKVKDEAGNDVFQKTEDGLYCHTIRYRKDSTKYITDEQEVSNNHKGFGFHYAPYHFDSAPEQKFFKTICQSLNAEPDEIQDIYFTGGLTSEKYTDFMFEYKDTAGKFRNYYPDFVVLKNNGEFIIVEVKASNKEGGQDADVVAKEKAVRKIENIAGNKFKYHILYSDIPIPTPKIHEIEQLIWNRT